MVGQGTTLASRLCLSQVCADYAWSVECGVILLNRFPAKSDAETTFSFAGWLYRFQEQNLIILVY